MPILSSLASISARAYGMMANALRIITDSFNRSNGSLGSADTGDPWSATRGTWSISSNQATSSDSGSLYPMATVNLNSQNAIVSADITDGGPGLAFWVTDANSWWASSVNYRSVYTSGGYYSGTSYAGTQAYYTGSLVASGCQYGCFTGVSCVDCDTLQPNGSPFTYSCTGPGGNASSGGGNCGTYVPATPGGCGAISGTANCNFVDTSYTTYYTELKLYKDISGTISTVATEQLNSNTSNYSKVNSIKVITSGDSITVSGYSNTGLSSQLGSSLTNNPSSPTKGTKVGIVKTSSDSSAGSVLDNFSAQAN